MGLFFGTDGIRGIVNADLTFELAYKCGNALSSVAKSPLVLIGRDTRISGEYLTLAVAGGVLAGGGRVVDLGVIPTSGVAYLTRKLGVDYGVVISASHNPKEYNGIKVFDRNGYKLGDKEEENLERCFIHSKINDFPDIGRFRYEQNYYKQYENFLTSQSPNGLAGMKIVLDCANGAAYKIAPSVFRRLGATVVACSSGGDGMRINCGCGALYPENLKRLMKKYKADVGFSFDGDADRLIAIDKDGSVIDGDMIIYILALQMQKRGILKNNTVVGTSHTNMSIERELAKHKIELIRTDIGDKYVLAKLTEKNLSLGGEQSGHIILKDVHSTGDGILTAIAISNVMKSEKASLGELFDVNLYPQTNVNIAVDDKLKIINSQLLSSEISKIDSALQGRGRVMVRASGTEPKIRIMVESEDPELNEKYSHFLSDLVLSIDNDA